MFAILPLEICAANDTVCASGFGSGVEHDAAELDLAAQGMQLVAGGMGFDRFHDRRWAGKGDVSSLAGKELPCQ